MMRRLPPKPRVCFPLTHAKSSVRFCTGTVGLSRKSIGVEGVRPVAEFGEVLRELADAANPLANESVVKVVYQVGTQCGSVADDQTFAVIDRDRALGLAGKLRSEPIVVIHQTAAQEHVMILRDIEIKLRDEVFSLPGVKAGNVNP